MSLTTEERITALERSRLAKKRGSLIMWSGIIVPSWGALLFAAGVEPVRAFAWAALVYGALLIPLSIALFALGIAVATAAQAPGLGKEGG